MVSYLWLMIMKHRWSQHDVHDEHLRLSTVQQVEVHEVTARAAGYLREGESLHSACGVVTGLHASLHNQSITQRHAVPADQPLPEPRVVTDQQLGLEHAKYLGHLPKRWSAEGRQVLIHAMLTTVAC